MGYRKLEIPVPGDFHRKMQRDIEDIIQWYESEKYFDKHKDTIPAHVIDNLMDMMSTVDNSVYPGFLQWNEKTALSCQWASAGYYVILRSKLDGGSFLSVKYPGEDKSTEYYTSSSIKKELPTTLLSFTDYVQRLSAKKVEPILNTPQNNSFGTHIPSQQSKPEIEDGKPLFWSKSVIPSFDDIISGNVGKDDEQTARIRMTRNNGVLDPDSTQIVV